MGKDDQVCQANDPIRRTVDITDRVVVNLLLIGKPGSRKGRKIRCIHITIRLEVTGIWRGYALQGWDKQKRVWAAF